MRTMSIKTVVLAITGFLPVLIWAQNVPDTMHFDSRVEQAFANSTELMYGSHQFGDNIARRMAILHETYTFLVPGDPSSPGTKTTVHKPVIYNAVKKLNSYYRKQAKSKIMDEKTAILELTHVLDVAISAYSQPTTAFETELRKCKKPEELAEVFKRVKIRK